MYLLPLQAPSSDAEAASSSGEEEHADAKAARRDKAEPRGQERTIARREKQKQEAGQAALGSKRKKKKRSREEGDAGAEDADVRLAMSNGRLAVDAQGIDVGATGAVPSKPSNAPVMSYLFPLKHCPKK